MIKLFELSVSALAALEQTRTSYKTTLKAFDVIRFSILEDLVKADGTLRGEIEADEAILEEKEREVVAEVPKIKQSSLES